MTYTTSRTYGALHFTQVTPLDPENVRFSCTVAVPEYLTTYSDPLLTLYALTAESGTAKHSKVDIDTLMKRHGITLTVAGGAGVVSFTVAVRRVNLHHAVNLLSEIIFHPKRSDDELKQKQLLLLEGNREAADDAKRIAHTNFMNTLYRDVPRGRTLTLKEERQEILRMTPHTMNKLEHALLRGEWYITFVGNESDERALTTLIRTLESTATPVSRTITTHGAQPSTFTFVTVPGKTNVELRIGNTLPLTPRDVAYIPLAFGLSVLGHVGGFSGRLMSTVREKEGLTYGIYASLNVFTYESTLYWNIYTFFTAKDLKKGIASTLREFTHIIERGITPRELLVFKEILKNGHVLAHDSNAKRLALYHSAALRGESELDIQSEHERIASLNAKEVNAALRTHLTPDALVMSAAGPVDREGNGILNS